MSDNSNMSDNIGNDELISQFMVFTGSSDASKASSYLEMCGNDVEAAVGLYMETEQTVSGSARVSSENTENSSAPMIDGPDDIRAPDATRTMRLMDDPMGLPDPSFHMMSALMEEQLHQSAFASQLDPIDARGAVNAAIAASTGDGNLDDGKENDEYLYDEEDEDDDDAINIVAPPIRLSDMFAAPIHLIHKAGGFSGARAMAKDTRRWLLVNIQRDAEFSSHALNRDVWRDELVENLIREGFIFWQQMDTTPEGRTYTERYQVYEFPHIGFIDPRTGRCLLRKEGWTQQNPLTAESFAEIAMDFCSRNSFDKPPQAPRPGNSAAVRPAKRTMHDMSEAEQIEAAMRASMESTPIVDSKQSSDNESTEIVDITDENDDSKPAAGSPPSTNSALLTMTVPDEPEGGARIQFRLPNGKKFVRMFSGSDPVKMIYAFIAQSNDFEKSGKDFSLLAGFPPKDLLANFDDTIEDAKLSGQAITMRWK